MREASIKIAIGKFAMEKTVQYAPEDEAKIIMGLVRAEAKKRYGFAVKFVGDGKLMREVVKGENDYFKREPRDPLPATFADFRAWAQRRGYLIITEVEG